MRVNNQEMFSNSSFVDLKNNDWLEKQRVAGKVVAKCLIHLENRVKEKTKLTLLELSKEAEQIILDNKCLPTFKGYKGFPEAVCISVNKQLVHGIPVDYILQEGDIVSFDLGATYEGAIADSAITCIYGEPKNNRHVELLKITEESLYKGIESIKVGNQLGCIGNAVYKHITNNGFNVITQYGGHSLTWNNPHSSPFVANKANINEGVRIQPGLTIAIEPMAVIGSTMTVVDKDGWTVSCNDISSHVEHTLYIHEDSVEIITDRNYEK